MASVDLTGRQALGWTVVGRGKPQDRKQFWTSEHECGTRADLLQTLWQSVLKGKTTTMPPCMGCTAAAELPHISHGMLLHLACGQTHLVGTPCGKAGPGECVHGLAWQTCEACSGADRLPRPAPGAYVAPFYWSAFDDAEPDEGEMPAAAVARIEQAIDAVVAEHAATLPVEPAVEAFDWSIFGPDEPEILRNGRGQPMIVPPQGGKAVAYTRASTFANTLDDPGGLTTWRLRLAALGMARNPDLAMMAAALEYGDRELDDIIETAHDRAGGNEKANWGTAVHSYTDPRDDAYVPEVMRSDVEAYRHALAERGIEIVSTSKFVVNDLHRVAGTYDNVLELPDGRRVMSDKKTGTLHPLACAIQLALYAGGEHYRLDDDGKPVRTPLDVDQDVAIIAHIPKGSGRCELHEVDLRLARNRANLAAAVRAARRDKAISAPMPPAPVWPAYDAAVAELVSA